MTQEMKMNLSDDGSKLVVLHARETVLDRKEVEKLLKLNLTPSIERVMIDVLNDPEISFNTYEGKVILEIITKLQKLL